MDSRSLWENGNADLWGSEARPCHLQQRNICLLKNNSSHFWDRAEIECLVIRSIRWSCTWNYPCWSGGHQIRQVIMLGKPALVYHKMKMLEHRLVAQAGGPHFHVTHYGCSSTHLPGHTRGWREACIGSAEGGGNSLNLVHGWVDSVYRRELNTKSAASCPHSRVNLESREKWKSSQEAELPVTYLWVEGEVVQGKNIYADF